MNEQCAKCGGVIRGTVDTQMGETVCCCDGMRVDPGDCTDDRPATLPPVQPKKRWELTDEDRMFLRQTKIDPDK